MAVNDFFLNKIITGVRGFASVEVKHKNVPTFVGIRREKHAVISGLFCCLWFIIDSNETENQGECNYTDGSRLVVFEAEPGSTGGGPTL